MADEKQAEPSAIADAARRLLAEHPDATVAAMASLSGVYCEMPPSVPLHGQSVIRTGRLYELAPARFRAAIFDAWRRVHQHGFGSAPVHLHDDRPATLYFLDTRATFEVVLAIVVPGGPIELSVDELGPERPARPRFGRTWRNDLAWVIRADHSAEQLLGFTEDELRTIDPIQLIHPEQTEIVVENWMETIGTPGVARRCRCRHQRKDGSYVWLEITNTSLPEDEHHLVLTEMVDISEEMEVNEQLREREELLQRIAESIPLGILQADRDGSVSYTNRRLYEILGVSRGTTLEALFAHAVAEDRRRISAAFERVLRSGVDIDVDLRIDRVDRDHQRICRCTVRPFRDDAGDASGTVITVEDVTASTALRRELERQATLDLLTGCHNRTSTLSTLERLVGHRPDPPAGTGVVFIDLDEFKPVNDRLGHATGDRVLIAAGERLRRAVRGDDLVGRIGGDEFLVVCPDAAGPHVPMAVAERIVTELAEHLALPGGETVVLRASLGVAWSENGLVSADELVARADACMYAAKRRRDGVPVLAVVSGDDES